MIITTIIQSVRLKCDMVVAESQGLIKSVTTPSFLNIRRARSKTQASLVLNQQDENGSETEQQLVETKMCKLGPVLAWSLCDVVIHANVPQVGYSA